MSFYLNHHFFSQRGKLSLTIFFFVVSEPLAWCFFFVECFTSFLLDQLEMSFEYQIFYKKNIIFNIIILWGSLNYLFAQLQPELTVIFLIFDNWRFESKKATSIFDLSWRHLKKKIHRINWIQFQSISPVKRLLTWTSPVAAVKFCYDL